MKGLSTLIRVRTWELEERRRRLADLEGLRDQILGMIAQLEQDVRTEQGVAASDIEAGYTYGGFAQAAIERRQKLEGSLEEVRQQVRAAMEEVTIAYQELKKYEVAHANRKRREAEELNRREQIRMDDMAIEGFRRRTATAAL